MIVICDKAQDIVIPAGLGDNAGVVYEKSGVESLNGQQGDLTLKTVNGNELLGEGDVAIDTGVESLNGQKGALTLKTVNGNELTGEGNIEIQAGVESVNGQTGALKLKTIDNKDVLGEGNMDILSDYSICMFMMYNLTLSEADKGVDLYKYGIGDDAANLDKYFSGLKTIQFLNFNIKDGASYKVPLTVFWDGNGNRQFRFVCEGYEYTYTSTDANYCDFTSKVKIGGESGLKYFDLTADKAKEAYDEVANHWDDKSGYTGDYVFRYKKENGGVYTFDEMGYIKDHSISFSWLDNASAYDVNGGNIKCFAIIIWKDGYNLQTYENDFTIPTKTSQLTNDSAFQTKSEVDTAIQNAISGGSGNQNVIVLDGLTQEEVKAIYDKLDKTKVPDAVFVYLNSYSFRTYWDGEGNLNFDIFRASYDAIELSKVTVTKTGEIYRGSEVQSYTNSCLIKVDSHVNETDPFECSYIGSFLEYLQRVYNKPYAYFIMFNNGIGDSTKPVYAPFTVIWDNNNFDGTSPIRIQFIANEKLYTYLHGDTDNKWIFEKSAQIGGVQSTEVSNIKVLTQSEYDALEPKDPNTMYCIKSQ